MKVNHVRTLGARMALYAAPLSTLVLGFCLQACGGAGPDGEPTPGEPTAQEKTGQSTADLSILGLNIPQPTITFGLGDTSTTINPIGAIPTQIGPPGGRRAPQSIRADRRASSPASASPSLPPSALETSASPSTSRRSFRRTSAASSPASIRSRTAASRSSGSESPRLQVS